MLISAEAESQAGDGGCSEGCAALAYWVYGEASDRG